MGKGLLDFIPVIGPALDFASNLVSAHRASDNFATRYQTQVADLKAAGLNPALAYGQSPGAGPTTVPAPELGTDVTRAIQGVSQAKAASAQAANTEAQTALLQAQKDDIIAGTRLKNKLLGAQVGATEAGTALTTAQTATEGYKPALLALDTQLKRTDLAYQRATTPVKAEMLSKQLEQLGIQIDIDKINRTLADLEVPEAKAGANFYQGAGQYAPYLTAAKPLLSLLPFIGNLFKGNTSAGAPAFRSPYTPLRYK